MNTLIELYDERAIENILAPDMFRPRRIVYLCPGEIAQDRTRQETLAAFFRRRGWEPELIFVETSRFKADRILRQLLNTYNAKSRSGFPTIPIGIEIEGAGEGRKGVR